LQAVTDDEIEEMVRQLIEDNLDEETRKAVLEWLDVICRGGRQRKAFPHGPKTISELMDAFGGPAEFATGNLETRPKPRDANPLAILQCRLITTAVADARGAQDPRAMPFDRGKRQRMRVCDRWRSFANFYLDVGK
jgi:hypothetical protein